jgi:hypothetical protein
MSVTTIPQMEAVVDRLLDQKAGKRPYRTFFPLMRVKGHLLKMHRTKLSNYQRYIYLNPIEGVLISYKNTNKFPHAPNYMINLQEITLIEFMRESRWFFKNGFYYFRIVASDKENIFYDNNLDMVNFAIT